MKWSDISTAPTDGTVVDLWVKAKDHEFRAANMRYDTDHYAGVTGWCCNGTDRILEHAFGGVGLVATHWMRRPQSPQEQEEEERRLFQAIDRHVTDDDDRATLRAAVKEIYSIK